MADTAHRLVRPPRLAGVLPPPGPARRLVFLTVGQSAGSGLFLTAAATFLVRVVGLRAGQVGLGLSLAALAGLLAAVPIGRLADRVGAWRLLVADYALLAVAFALYPLSRTFGLFVLSTCAISIAELSASPLRSAVLFALGGRVDPLRTRAQLRTAFNLGYLLGAAVAGVALARPTATTFWVMLLGIALVHAGCAVLALNLRPVPVEPDPGGPDSGVMDSGAGVVDSGSSAPAGRPRIGSALRDRRLLRSTVANGFMELHATILAVGIPLWIISHTRAPLVLNSILVVTNTVLVVLLQVRLSRGGDTVAGSVRLERRAAIVLAFGCAVCMFSAGRGPVGASGWLIGGVAILAIGEIWQVSGGWGLSFALPPEGRQGEGQAVFGLGRGIQQFVGPALATFLLVAVGSAGWLVFAGLFLLVGLIALPLAARDPLAAKGSAAPH